MVCFKASTNWSLSKIGRYSNYAFASMEDSIYSVEFLMRIALNISSGLQDMCKFMSAWFHEHLMSACADFNERIVRKFDDQSRTGATHDRNLHIFILSHPSTSVAAVLSIHYDSYFDESDFCKQSISAKLIWWAQSWRRNVSAANCVRP